MASQALQAQGRNRRDTETVFVNQKGMLVSGVSRAPVFDNPQTAGGDLIRHPVIEQDDAIGNVLFELLPGQRTFAAFGCDDGGYALVFEPGEQAAQFRLKAALIL